MSDWQEDSLGSLAKGIRGVSYRPDQLKEFASESTVTLLRSNNIQDGALDFDGIQIVADTCVSDSQLLCDGDVAVCMSNGSKALVGKAAPFSTLPGKFTVGAFCSIFRPEPGAEQKFVSYVFQSQGYRKHLDVTLAGSAINNLRNKDLESYRLKLPPVREQQKIAQILDTLDTQIRQTEALIAKLERIKQGLLTDLLTRGIDQNVQLRPTPNQAPHLYKDSPLGRIPREWTVEPLGTLSEIVSGVTLGGAPPGLSARRVPYLRVANVQDGFLDLAEIKYIRVTASDAEKFRLREGDVLMNEGGDYDKLGRGTVWRNEVADCIHQNHVFRVRPDQSALLPEYLAAYSASPGGKAYFLRASKQSTNLASINSTQLKAFPIPLAPVHEQQAINSALSGMNARIDHEGASLRKLLTQKSGLMDDLLTGRVRVTPLLDTAATT